MGESVVIICYTPPSLGLRAPAAWQSRGVFHNIIRFEYYQKRCVSIWFLRQLDKEFTIKIAHL